MLLVRSLALREINREFFNLFYSKHTLRCKNKNLQGCPNKIQNTIVNHFSLSTSNLNSNLDDEKPSKVFIKNSKTTVLKKKNATPKIFLQNVNGSVTVVHLDEAEKLARHKGLSLKCVEDSRPSDPMPRYQLIKKSDLIKEVGNTNKDTSKSKGKIKNFILKTDISANDLRNKISLMLKSLDKNSAVLIEIIKKNENSSKMEQLFNSIKKELNENHRIEYSNLKGSGMKIKIVPCADNKNKKDEEKESKENEEGPEKDSQTKSET